MSKLFKFWTREKKEYPRALSETEVRLIEGKLLPRWNGPIPTMLKNQSAIDDFREFSAQLKQRLHKAGETIKVHDSAHQCHKKPEHGTRER